MGERLASPTVGDITHPAACQPTVRDILWKSSLSSINVSVETPFLKVRVILYPFDQQIPLLVNPLVRNISFWSSQQSRISAKNHLVCESKESTQGYKPITIFIVRDILDPTKDISY